MIEELPRFHEFFTPALAVLNSGNTMRSRDIVAKVSDQLGLTAEQRSQVISSGQRRLDNRVAWALNYLFHAQAVRKPSRGVFQITDRGRDLALAHPDGFGVDTLGQFEEFRAFKARSKGSAGSQIDPPCAAADAGEQTPLEQVSAAVEQLDADVAAELVQRLHAAPPEFLEKAVLRLLVAMGYGGSDEAAVHLGGPGDGGCQFARSITPRVILIDGVRLGQLMITHGVGVQERQTFRVVETDEDFFEEA